MGLLLALTVGHWLPREAPGEPKNPSPAGDRVGLFARNRCVCAEVHPNRGISLPFICGQGREAPGSFSKSQASLAPAMWWLPVRLGGRGAEGGVHAKRHFVPDHQLEGSLLCAIFSSQDLVFPGCFHKYVKNAAPKGKRSNIYLVFNNIKSRRGVFVSLICRLRSVASCEWERKISLWSD